jgi:hypothetical protein
MFFGSESSLRMVCGAFWIWLVLLDGYSEGRPRKLTHLSIYYDALKEEIGREELSPPSQLIEGQSIPNLIPSIREGRRCLASSFPLILPIIKIIRTCNYYCYHHQIPSSNFRQLKKLPFHIPYTFHLLFSSHHLIFSIPVSLTLSFSLNPTTTTPLCYFKS